ncbi:carbamoyltransferase HypF, partial [Chloroflexota bacterium]
AGNEAAVNLLRERKRRPAKPFAVMLTNLTEISNHCFISKEEENLLQSAASPIVLVRRKENDLSVSPAVSPNLKYLGVMLPYTPLHHLILYEINIPLVMTSGNLSEEPIARDNDEALTRLKGIADYFLLHNRDIYSRYDDSVAMVVNDNPQMIRRARGYAPYPVFLTKKSKQVLACGAELKNTFCLTKENHAFLSQHIGDMENEETLTHFENTVELYKKLFRIEPEVIACDMHPEYLATKYARKLKLLTDLPLIPVQHHHAHIASCLADNGIDGPVIGVAFDGTGYGSDSKIWGGEFLLADNQNSQRMGHLEYLPLPGGEAAIKKPYRIALSYLYTLLGENFPLDKLPLNKYNPTEFELIKQQIKQGINCPETSSAGRLFDAVSALSGIKEEVNYEAQAAIELEMLANDKINTSATKWYPFSIIEDNGMKSIKLEELFRSLIKDIERQIPLPEISARFHGAMTQMVIQMCKILAKETGVKKVALSGGVWQNRLLFMSSTNALLKEGFKVITHHRVPTNDGGIALGQAVIANLAAGS